MERRPRLLFAHPPPSGPGQQNSDPRLPLQHATTQSSDSPPPTKASQVTLDRARFRFARPARDFSHHWGQTFGSRACACGEKPTSSLPSERRTQTPQTMRKKRRCISRSACRAASRGVENGQRTPSPVNRAMSSCPLASRLSSPCRSAGTSCGVGLAATPSRSPPPPPPPPRAALGLLLDDDDEPAWFLRRSRRTARGVFRDWSRSDFIMSSTSESPVCNAAAAAAAASALRACESRPKCVSKALGQR